MKNETHEILEIIEKYLGSISNLAIEDEMRFTAELDEFLYDFETELYKINEAKNSDRIRQVHEKYKQP